MFIPTTTYRIQFCSDYNFNHLREDLGYFKSLGISTIYASPIFKASTGSTHGYDVVDMNQLNPELGTKKDFESLIEKLHKLNMTWVQDIVPNHMAYSPENAYIYDVLEKGRKSVHAPLFDIYWDHHDPQLTNRIMVPCLGSKLNEVIENKEVELSYTRDGFVFKYYENEYPLCIESYDQIFEAADKLVTADPKKRVWQTLKSLGEKAKIGSPEDLQYFKDYFCQKLLRSEFLFNTIVEVCNYINNKISLLKNLLNDQHYKLCYWKETELKINYRRFFTVNDLICVRVEDEDVFNFTHRLVKSYCEAGFFQGVRVDHIDGLLNPNQYLHRLRNLLGKDCYIVVEKILSRDENIEEKWPVQGTTGYDFLGQLNQLIIDSRNETKFDVVYQKLINANQDLAQLIYDKKWFVLRNRMSGELENLCQELNKLIHEKSKSKPLFEALTSLLSAFPVYRTYIDIDNPDFPEILNKAIHDAVHFDPEHKSHIEILRQYFDTSDQKKLQFIRRFQQLSGPLAAKGVEDTVYYLYNRFIMQNEVGDEPDIFGISTHTFLNHISRRMSAWPFTMNTTSTHDTKRGEDSRARLSVISEIPELWKNFIDEMNEFHFLFKPFKNDQYLIWQSIIGAWPMNEKTDREFKKRLKQFIQKALREGKNQTSWADPNIKYEESCFTYCDAILENHESHTLFEQIIDLIKIPGTLKSLVQVIIKFTMPGVADVYQGNELWNLSFVDPDNRHLVDYEKRKNYLFEIQQAEKENNIKSIFYDLWLNKIDDKLKFYITYRLLQERIINKEMFFYGKLLSLKNDGNYITYLRVYKGNWIFVNVPLMCHDLSIPSIDMKEIPPDLPESWRHVFTNEQGSIEDLLKLNALTVLINN